MHGGGLARRKEMPPAQRGPRIIVLEASAEAAARRNAVVMMGRVGLLERSPPAPLLECGLRKKAVEHGRRGAVKSHTTRRRRL